MTRDQTPAHNTIPVEKFAKRVASAVCRFIDVSLRFWDPGTEDSTEFFWRAGGIEDAGPGTRGALADRPRCHHQGRRHHHWSRPCFTRELAADSPIETLRVLKIPPLTPPRGIISPYSRFKRLYNDTDPLIRTFGVIRTFVRYYIWLMSGGREQS